METPIEVLRVEQSGISKELNRFRACDSETRSLYCREWAQYIYKKHFVWNAKTQEEIVPEGDPTSATTLKAGKYQINFLNTVSYHRWDCEHADDHGHQSEEQQQRQEDNVPKKERSNLLGKKFEELAASWSTTEPTNGDERSLLNQIMAACQLWMTLPSGYTGLPESFEPVEFNPYPDAIPLVEDEKDPSQLLDPLIIERQALCLPSDCFHLLKNLTGDILLSHTTPTCNHSKPTAKTPTDLEVDRAIFNEHEANAVTQALKELSIALEKTWYPLNHFLKQLGGLEKRRNHLMGKGCQANIDEFFANQKYVSFVDRWTSTEQAQFKNKKSTDEEINKVDTLFEQHLNHLKSLVKEFMSKFVPTILEDIHVLTNDLWKMVVPTIYELGERMAKREASKGSENAAKIGESLKSLDVDYLKKMESTKEVDSSKKRITAALNTKVEEYMAEIDALFKLYKESARPNLSGRLEKLNNKEFKKKIKKVESGYYSIRQTFRYEVTEKIFPESLFCKFALVCLEPLLQEGEMVEALTIETEVKRFMDAYKDLWKTRDELLDKFEEGVQTGRRELAGVLGKLFLKEGMRIQGDNLALKRQNSLLKSMGMDVPEEEPKKKSKGKKKSASGASTPAQQEPVATVSTPAKKSAAVKNSATPVTPPAKSIEAGEKKKGPEVAKKVASPVAAAASAEPVAAKPVSDSVKSVTPVKPVSPAPVAPAKPPSPAPAKAASPAPAPPKAAVPVATPKKSESKPLTKVKSSKIPAPAPILEPKVEPKSVVEKKKKTVEKSNNKKKEVQQNDDIQDWDMIRTSVTAAESNKKVKEQEAPVEQNWNDIVKSVSATEEEVLEVQDWNDLRAQVQQQKDDEKKAAAEEEEEANRPGGKSVESNGWSAIAAKKPVVETSWSNAATAASSETSSLKDNVDLDGWGTPVVKKAVVSPSLSTASSAWSTTASAGGAVSSAAGGHGWGAASPAVVEKSTISAPPGWGAPGNEKPAVSAPPGWGAPGNEKPAVSAPPGWGASPVIEKSTVASGWGASSTVVDKPAVSAPPGWGTSPAVVTENPVVSAPSGWGALVAEKKSNPPPGWSSEPVAATSSAAEISSSLGGWGKPDVSAAWASKSTAAPAKAAASSKLVSSSPTWNAPNKASTGGWDNTQLPWNDEVSTATTTSASVASAPAIPRIDTTPKAVPSVATSIPVSSKPPGLSLDAPIAERTSVAAATASIVGQPLSASTATAAISPFGLAPNSQPQYQEPLPSNLSDMSADMLATIVKNLHRENGTLIQSVYAMQQEMSMMTTRYAEIMALAREREAQTLQLFESRKQTEMEEARRYVLSLEARINQMEEKSQQVTAGFGNQDLFAGYREEMRTSPNPSNNTTSTSNHHHHQNHHHHNSHHHGKSNNNYNNNGRKLWQKNNIVRCGNCGEIGHESAECKTNCRYCGSSEHLSEACPMN